MKRNLVLLGYRGTGKTTIGLRLAARTGWPVVSIDQAIAEVAGLTIPEIVDRFGWPHFRALERQQVRRVAALSGQILDCGGGVVEDAGNVADLRAGGFCVLLTARVGTIAERIGGDANRPSLTGRPVVEEIEEKLRERGPLYEAAADLVVPTDDITPEQAVERIFAAAPPGLLPRGET